MRENPDEVFLVDSPEDVKALRGLNVLGSVLNDYHEHYFGQ